MSVENIKIEKDGKEYWVSRSIVVTCPIFKIVNGSIYTLIEQRGHKVSCTGKWCVPCGYLDYGETLIDACVREVKEETNLYLNSKDFYFLRYDDEPKGMKQNVHMFFYNVVPFDTNTDAVEIVDKGEVLSLTWIKIGTIKKSFLKKPKLTFEFKELNQYRWAFSHNKLIVECMVDYCKRNRIKIKNEEDYKNTLYTPLRRN